MDEFTVSNVPETEQKPEPSKETLAQHAEAMYAILLDAESRLLNSGYFGLAYRIGEIREAVDGANA